MLNIQSVDHLNLNVKNLQISVDFYSKHFGMSVKEEGIATRGNPYKIIGKPGSLYLCLYEGDSSKSLGRMNHLGIQVNDFDQALAYIKKEKIPVSYELIDYGVSRSIYIEDPDGMEIELSEVFGGGLG